MTNEEDELLRTRNELQHVLDNLPAAILVYDRDGTILEANHAAASALGTLAGDLKGTNIVEYRAEEHRDTLAEIDRHVLETGTPTLAREFADEPTPGETRTLSMSWVPIHDPTGHDRIYSMAIDVSEQRRQSEVLQASEARLRVLNEQLTISSALSQVGFWSIDMREGQLFWSDEVFRIHGLDPERDPQPSLAEAINYYHPADLGMVERAVQSALQRSEEFEFDARVVRADQQIRFVRANCRIVRDDDGEAMTILGAFQDNTHDKRREEQLQTLLEELSRSNEELSRFSYVCSHDMKEPVRTVETMTQMLLDPEVSADGDRRDELVRRINKNMVRLRTIIDSLLAYSRVDAKIENVEVSLADVANDVIDSMQTNIDEAGATVHVEPLPVVTGARVHFVQLFQNLLSNALKYATVEQPLVHFRWKTFEEHHVISVEDNGPGIRPDERDRAFELFGRLDSSIGIEGVGVGLAICHRIASQYSGMISCTESDLGGAAFEIRLPLNPHREDSDIRA